MTDPSAIVAASALWFVTFAVFYVWTALALGAVFRKSGEQAWKAWVPVLNSVTLFRLGGLSGWLVLLYIVPVAGWVVQIIACHRIGGAFGFGVGMTVLSAILLPVWASIVGFGSARWVGREDAAGPRRSAPPALAPPTAPAPAAPSAFAPVSAPPAYERAEASAPRAAAPVRVSPPPGGWTPPPLPVSAPPAPIAGTPVPAPPVSAPPAPAPAPPVSAPPAPIAGTPAAPVERAPEPAAPALSVSAPPVSAPPVSAPSAAPARAAMRAPDDEDGLDEDTSQPAARIMRRSAPASDEDDVDDEGFATPGPRRAASADPWAPSLSPPPEEEAFAETSGPVSAVAGAPQAGGPRSALSSVSAQVRMPQIPDDPLDETIIARRKRTDWTLILPVGAPVALTSDIVLLGRRPSADPRHPSAQLVSIDDGTVSKTHARLELRDDVWYVTDLDSTNGVVFATVLGTEVEATPGVEIEAGDRFLLGDAEIRLSRSGR